MQSAVNRIGRLAYTTLIATLPLPPTLWRLRAAHTASWEEKPGMCNVHLLASAAAMQRQPTMRGVPGWQRAFHMPFSPLMSPQVTAAQLARLQLALLQTMRLPSQGRRMSDLP